MSYYTLREVILGLKDEYQKNEKTLEGLKKYINVTTDKELSEFAFYSYNFKDSKYIQLLLEEKQNRIIKTLNNIKNRLANTKTTKETPVSRESQKQYKYLVLPTNKLYETTGGDFDNSFYNAVDKILSDTFHRNIDGKIELADERLVLETNPERIIATTLPGRIDYPSAGIIYSSKLNQLIITGYDEELFNDHLDNIFNIRINQDFFNAYQRRMIDSNPNSRKKLVITGNSATRNSQYFSFDDQDDETVVLRRIKKDKKEK